MKTLNLFKWGCLLMVLFTGCSKDDDENKIEAATLIGAWEMVSGRGYDKDVSTGVISNESSLDYTGRNAGYVFKQDGTYEGYENEQTWGGTWSLEGEKLSTAGFDGLGLMKYDVLKLNASELVLLHTFDRITYLSCSEFTLQRK